MYFALGRHLSWNKRIQLRVWNLLYEFTAHFNLSPLLFPAFTTSCNYYRLTYFLNAMNDHKLDDFKMQKFTPITVLEAIWLLSTLRRATLPPESLGGEASFLASSASGGSWYFLAYNHITLVSASVFTWPSSQCLLFFQGHPKFRVISSWEP